MESAGTKVDGQEQEGAGIAVSPNEFVEASTRGEVDVQITTAKHYPRSVRQFLQTAKEMATLDEETAASCFYALPRAGKTIEGPSARLAEIVASAWGHMRVEGRIVAIDETFVVARGVAWDLQSNNTWASEVRRRITDKYGRRYSEDMIIVTSNAAISIALRNAVFKVVPQSHWKTVYDECRQVVRGDAMTLDSRRTTALEHFQKLGVLPERVFATLQVKGLEDITLDHLVILRGLSTAITEVDTTIDEAFPPPQGKAEGPKRISETAKAASASTEPPATGQETKPADEPQKKKPEQKHAAATEGQQEETRERKADRIKRWIAESGEGEFMAVDAIDFAKQCKGLKDLDLMVLSNAYNERRLKILKARKSR